MSRFEKLRENALQGFEVVSSFKMVLKDATGDYLVPGTLVKNDEGFRLVLRGELPQWIKAYPETEEGLVEAVQAIQMRTGKVLEWGPSGVPFDLGLGAK